MILHLPDIIIDISHIWRYTLLYPGLPSDIDHFMNCGADKVLLKPLDTKVFGQAMKEITKV